MPGFSRVIHLCVCVCEVGGVQTMSVRMKKERVQVNAMTNLSHGSEWFTTCNGRYRKIMNSINGRWISLSPRWRVSDLLQGAVFIRFSMNNWGTKSGVYSKQKNRNTRSIDWMWVLFTLMISRALSRIAGVVADIAVHDANFHNFMVKITFLGRVVVFCWVVVGPVHCRPAWQNPGQHISNCFKTLHHSSSAPLHIAAVWCQPAISSLVRYI
jgi:hypothetical protein